jgi:hypothetical protein
MWVDGVVGELGVDLGDLGDELLAEKAELGRGLAGWGRLAACARERSMLW